MDASDTGSDVYVAALRSIFDGCVTSSTGQLGLSDLPCLYSDLQLSPKVAAAVGQRIKISGVIQVTFDQFYKAFLAALRDLEDEVGPNGSVNSVNRISDLSESNHDAQLLSDIRLRLEELAATNQSDMNAVNNSLSSQMSVEESLLREIWNDLGVGQDGFLDEKQLGLVCEHIGMTELSNKELGQLFTKLDLDADGRVSFEEFLHGLFKEDFLISVIHNKEEETKETNTQNRPMLSPRVHNGRVAFKINHSLTEPPVLLSFLDVNENGYTDAQHLIDFWEGFQINDGPMVLNALLPNANNRINIVELSAAVERELQNMEDAGSICRAVLGSLRQQLIYLRNHMEQVTLERNKCKTDLLETTKRIDRLIAESDERYISLEKNKDNEIKLLQKNISELKRKSDGRSDSDLVPVKQQSLQSELDRLKEKEGKLSAKLLISEQDRQKIEDDLVELSTKYKELQTETSQQKKHLSELDDFKLQLREMELNREDEVTKCQQLSEKVVLLKKKKVPTATLR